MPGLKQKLHFNNSNGIIDKNAVMSILSNFNDFYRIKPFKCEYCGFSFKRKYDLIRYTRLHTGVKPYKCEICKKAFYRLDALKRHMKINPDCSSKNPKCKTKKSK